jgi:polyisoprenyl-teichoic acid--peptidoglycan teichoic acid transferase
MVVAGLLSLLVPGVGQLYRGATRRGLILLAIAFGIVACGLILGSWLSLDALSGVNGRIVALVVLVDLAVMGFRVFAVVDAARGALPVLVACLVALTAAPHVAAAWVTVRSYDVLASVFADEEPCSTACDRGTLLLSHVVVPMPEWVPKDAWEWALVERLGPGEVAPLQADARVLEGDEVPVAKPWTTILLLGTDEGPGNWGARTDTIILAAIQHGTGRAAAFGVPRNLAQVPLGPKGTPFPEPINALYGRSGDGDTGARNLKQAVSTLLGIRVDYYALVNLVGFADLVDALGGVEILVKERLHDEVTRPAWGEPKPKIDVVPGRRYRFYGREALAYVRSRKDSSDYTRMARQRCFLSAMADQLDPVRAIRNFGSLAKTIESNVHTAIPLNRLPSLVRLVSSVDTSRTLTVTFGFDYFFGRQESGNYPVPALGRMQRTVRQAILTPERLQRQGKAKTASQSC